jgi:hypothetical protein
VQLGRTGICAVGSWQEVSTAQVEDAAVGDNDNHPAETRQPPCRNRTRPATKADNDGVWITGEVDLPAAVIDAHAAGTLVIFVGAGVSKNPPSDLPLFDGLAEQIASRVARPYDGHGHPDIYLGRLEKDGVNVHRLAVEILSRPDSQPNANHRALILLAVGSPKMRLVTTNYDDHLRSAARELGIDIPNQYSAPALPLGRSFEGLIHLHGSVLRPDEIVLTEGDFGRAYLTDAWAARFLERMFAHFTVLFVGYSHDDTVMNYIATGITHGKERFAFTDQPEAPKWHRLDITPIGYPNVDGHRALTEAVEEWQRRASMGLLDARNRIRDIVLSDPPQAPVDRDYIAHMVETRHGARFFAEFAQKETWLDWLETQPVFLNNFGVLPLDDASAALGRWFVDKFIRDLSRHDKALGIFQRHGSELNPSFRQVALSCAIEIMKSGDPSYNRWIPVLTRGIKSEGDAMWQVDYFLAECQWPRDRNAVLLLLHRFLRPNLSLRPSFSWGIDPAEPSHPAPTGELSWSLHINALQELRRKVEEYGLEDSLELLPILEQSVFEAYLLLETYNGPDSFDSLSFRRSAIEPTEQDSMREAVDEIIDGLRDLAEVLVRLDRGQDLIDRWWASGHLLLRRLVVHVSRVRDDWSSNERIQWILKERLLYDVFLHHEVYILLGDAIAAASPPVLAQLLQVTLSGPDPDGEPDGQHRPYRIFNLLFWLSSNTQAWHEAQAAFAEMGAQHPDFEVRSHPEFTHYMEVGFHPEPSEELIEAFIERLRSNAVEALRWIIELPRESFRVLLDWYDVAQTVAQATERDPRLGLSAWTAAYDTSLIDRSSELIAAIMHGWAKAALPADAWREILALANGWELEAAALRALTDLLVSGVDGSNGSIPEDAIILADSIAVRCWEEFHGSYSHGPTRDWTNLGLNSWPGTLARYWILRVSRDWQASGDQWNGLDEQKKIILGEMISCDGLTCDATRPVIGRELYFLFDADQAFTIANLFPRFDWLAEAAAAEQLWYGYLYGNRINNRMVETGFLDVVESASGPIAHTFDSPHRHRYYSLVVSILNYSDVEEARKFLLVENFVRSASEIEFIEFIESIAATLGLVEDADEVNAIWQDWLGDFLHGVMNGSPRELSQKELSAVPSLIPLLVKQFEDFASWILSQEIGLEDDPYWLGDLVESDLVRTSADKIVKLLTHLLENTADEVNMVTAHNLDRVCRPLRQFVNQDDYRRLVEVAMERGVLEADTWLS